MQDFIVISMLFIIGILLQIMRNTSLKGSGAVADNIEKIEQNTRWRGRS